MVVATSKNYAQKACAVKKLPQVYIPYPCEKPLMERVLENLCCSNLLNHWKHKIKTNLREQHIPCCKVYRSLIIKPKSSLLFYFWCKN